MKNRQSLWLKPPALEGEPLVDSSREAERIADPVAGPSFVPPETTSSAASLPNSNPGVVLGLAASPVESKRGADSVAIKNCVPPEAQFITTLQSAYGMHIRGCTRGMHMFVIGYPMKYNQGVVISRV